MPKRNPICINPTDHSRNLCKHYLITNKEKELDSSSDLETLHFFISKRKKSLYASVFSRLDLSKFLYKTFD